MEFGQKKIREIDLFDFTSFFGLDFFKFSGPLWTLCTSNSKIFGYCFQGEYPISNGRGGHHEHDEESNDRFSRGRPGDFRPESGNNLFFNIIILALMKLYN